jgi:putative ABC transport system permease protein
MFEIPRVLMGKKISYFSSGLFNVSLRYLLRNRLQSILMLLGVALGVTLLVAIDLANVSAQRSFELSVEAVTGKATHQLVTADPRGIDESVYVNLRMQGVHVPIAPVLLAYVTVPRMEGRTLQLMGIDPIADVPFRSYLSLNGQVPLEQLVLFLTKPGAVFIARNMADQHSLDIGETLEIEIGGQRREIWIAGILEPKDALSRRALDGLLLADIATAQELTGRVGRLDRIDLILPTDSNLVHLFAERLPPDIRLEDATTRSDSLEQMTAAFRINLTALSMLALVVGLFLIYNTMTFAVVQRRELFGTLRCLGVTRREIFVLVVGEAFLVGILGSTLGIISGIILGRQTTQMVTQTINDLYFTTTVQSVELPVESLIKGVLVGVTATMLAAVLPAWEAASVPPRAALLRSGLEARTRRKIWLASALGIVTIGLGIGLFSFPAGGLFAGFVGTFLLVVGIALLSALLMVVFLQISVHLLGGIIGFVGRMAPRSLINSLSRTSVAVAALMVAVAVTIAVNLMIDSFRYTVTLWLEATLQGDIYISAPTLTATIPSQPVVREVINVVEVLPSASRVNYSRSITVDSSQGAVRLSAISNERIGWERLFLKRFVPLEQIWQALQQGQILVSEPLARRANLLTEGSVLRLFTPQGWQTFRIAGVYYDYASSEGAILMSMDVYQKVWQDDSVTAIDLRLRPGADVDQTVQDLQKKLGDVQELLIRPNRVLRAAVMEVFDRTFAITTALRFLATVVAFIGVLNALLLQQIERRWETGVLQALGLTGKQLWQLVMLETGLMGLSAGLLAAPTGYVLALVLIYVINQRSFGWTLQLLPQPAAFFQALVISLAAALLAGLFPAWRMNRLQASQLIRNE